MGISSIFGRVDVRGEVDLRNLGCVGVPNVCPKVNVVDIGKGLTGVEVIGAPILVAESILRGFVMSNGD